METPKGRRVGALRGATTVERDEPAAIAEATTELVRALLERNGAAVGDLISVIFTSTADLTSDFPASAARAAGLADVPLLCSQEIPVPGSLPRCIRVLAHLYSDRAPGRLQHVYLHGARGLRSDRDV